MSTIACDIPRSALDEPAWRALCETAAAQATKGCGLSHDYYVERFSSAIDAQLGRLPEEQRAQALKIAQEFTEREDGSIAETRSYALNTATIVGSVASPDCLEYRVVGIRAAASCTRRTTTRPVPWWPNGPAMWSRAAGRSTSISRCSPTPAMATGRPAR